MPAASVSDAPYDTKPPLRLPPFDCVTPAEAGAQPSLFYRSPRRRTRIPVSAAVRAHPRRVCEGDFPLCANSSRAERPAGRPTGTDLFEPPSGGTPSNAATEGPPYAFSRVERAGAPSADSLLLFLCYWPKAINLPDTPASGVQKPCLCCESRRTPARASRWLEQRGTGHLLECERARMSGAIFVPALSGFLPPQE
jgi:hypothetical protein